jgi:plasmid stability protein
MSATLTIRNLNEAVKQKLRIQAAKNKRSMEAEAREILARGVESPKVISGENEEIASERRGKGKFDHLIGIWRDRMTTDEVMELTRGE